MENQQAFRIPRRSELMPLGKIGGKVDVKPQIEAALNDDDVIESIEAYKTNGGKCGDPRIDDVRAMDIILEWDDARDGTIRKSGLKEREILDSVNVVLRRRFVLDKKRKIVGVNDKHFKLLSQS